MGFGSFISSVCSGIGSAVGSIARGISSAISSTSRFISSFIGTAISAAGKIIGGKAGGLLNLAGSIITGPLGPILGPIVTQLVIKAVTKAIVFLAKELGVIQEKDKAEEVGYRLEEANKHDDWKKQEDFASFREYYQYLKEQIPDEQIDVEKLSKNKLQYEVLGAVALTKGLEECYSIKMPESFLFEIGRSRMETNEIKAIVEAYKFLGFSSVQLSSYLKGNLSPVESKRIFEAIIESMKKYYPMKSDKEIVERLNIMRINSKNDEMMAKQSYIKEIEELKQKQENADCLKVDYHV